MTTATRRRPLNGAGAKPAKVHVAVYARVSTDERLDMEFNSLEAQRAAVESYVESQRGEGWVTISEEYADGGYTGANTERPAFQRLLRDIEAGKVQVVACYKIDRISRSLGDFGRIMEFFSHHHVSFVSVTQRFDTSSSTGKLLLNILMSFAEFERQVISERTRDKIAATRKRGLWTGGTPILGYAVQEKKLVVVPDEAEQVREVFELYRDLGSLLAVAQELNRRGLKTKVLGQRAGKPLGGKPWDQHAVRRLLGNPLYAGKIPHGREVHDGVHEAIVDQATWNAVQHQLSAKGNGPGRPRTKWTALLQGILRCACGSSMTTQHSHGRKHRYLYYVCQRYQKEGAAACPGSRAPVGEMERVVFERIRDIGRDPRLVRETIAAAKRGLKERRPELERELRQLEKDRTRLGAERGNLLDAIAQAANGKGAASVLQRLGEVDVASSQVKERENAARGEVAVLENAAIDEEDLRAALASFDGVWSELFPQEKARVLHLLLERVTFDAGRGEVEITFRPSGVRTLAREDGKETE